MLSCYSFVIAVVVGKRSRQIAALHEHYERQQSQLMAGRVSLSSYFSSFFFFTTGVISHLSDSSNSERRGRRHAPLLFFFFQTFFFFFGRGHSLICPVV